MIRLLSEGNQVYRSEDGRIVVSLDSTYETECDGDPHPMRVSMDEWNSYTDHRQKQLRWLGAKLKNGRMCWQCPGGETHYYSQWVSEVDEDWTEFQEDTLGGMVSQLEKMLGEEIKVVRRKRIAVPVTHGAEMHVTVPEDISEQSMQALAAVGNAAADLLHRHILEDELQGINTALERYDELMASEMAEFVDQELHASHLRRKAEIEKELAI